MSIFAIGDLHLPGGDKKPMDVFGAHWERHFERICADWQSRVKPEDIVLIPGDISWAMQLSDALNDLREIAKLPGTILLLRGNHDYWWSSLSQLRACLPENMHAVQNDAFDAGDCVFCGTRGWTIPLGQNAAAQDESLSPREALRLDMLAHAAAQTLANWPADFLAMATLSVAAATGNGASWDGVYAAAERIRRQALRLTAIWHGQTAQRHRSGHGSRCRYGSRLRCGALGWRQDVSLEAAEG
ncbi:MAG: metallophosphoesterase [Christensenellales bacterium]